MVLNEVRKCEVRPQRGLRQGDPLSPYLFLFVADVLSSIFLKGMADKRLMGLKIKRRSPVISHLFFADDYLFLITTKVVCVSEFIRILQSFCVASGQCANLQKSGIIFSENTTDEQKSLLCHHLGMYPLPHQAKYFGIPTVWA